MTLNLLIGQCVLPVGWEEMGYDGGWGIIILASYKFQFIRVHVNLV